MTTHGVVFGGGGVLGVSWEIGVLAGLADAGVTPVAGARVVVGTSAGSVVGANAAAGAPVADLVAGELAPPDPAAPGMNDVMGLLDYQLLADLFVTWTGVSTMNEEVARQCGALALKQTTVTEERFLDAIATALRPEWPTTDLRIVAASCDTGRRTVWTRDSGVELVRAAASSCSIPGILPPITVDPAREERFMDGGVWSGTNADLLVDDALDAVVVIEPLSASTMQLGEFSAAALAAETAALEAAGAAVTVISADDVYGALSVQLMDPTARPEAVALGRAAGSAAAATVAALLG